MTLKDVVLNITNSLGEKVVKGIDHKFIEIHHEGLRNSNNEYSIWLLYHSMVDNVKIVNCNRIFIINGKTATENLCVLLASELGAKNTGEWK